ncbi:hypothetical protein [Candidatus Poriferisodalis sp.]|uniref:hypothetical protein n=1 Tax=Candidatus Poriferisodalis sp. TaxID=3101277 RepID=UPI003B02BA3D
MHTASVVSHLSFQITSHLRQWFVESAAAVPVGLSSTLATVVAAALTVSATRHCAAQRGAAVVGIRTALHRWRGSRAVGRDRSGTARSERGEGVISAAIAVLIIASLGALMWVGFKELWESAEKSTNDEIVKIGR